MKHGLCESAPLGTWGKTEKWAREWDEVTARLRNYFHGADKSTVKENGGKFGRNGKG